MPDYPAQLVRHVDADTTLCLLTLGPADVGLGMKLSARHQEKVRYAGINAPERGTPAGQAALAWLSTLLPVAFTLRTHLDERDNYGRLLGWLLLPDGRCVNRLLVDSGHAAAFGSLSIDAPAP